MAYKRQWLRPLKILESYVLGALGVQGIEDGTYQLYWAVIEGNVRGRHQGKELDAAEREHLRTKKWSDDPNEHWELPADIELSVEDAERIWRSREIDPADEIAVYGMSQGSLIISAETALLNLRVQLRRLETRQRTADGSVNTYQTEFESRWEKHLHEAKTYLAHIAEPNRRDPLLDELRALEAKCTELGALSDSQQAGPAQSSLNDNRPEPAPGPRFSKAKLRKWYEQRVKDHAKDEKPPSREDDCAAALAKFRGGVPRDAVRALRRELAPVKWKKGGHPKTCGRKPGGK